MSLAASLAIATDSMPPWPSGSMLSAVLSRATSANCSASCARVGTGAAAAASGTWRRAGRVGWTRGLMVQGMQRGRQRPSGTRSSSKTDSGRWQAVERRCLRGRLQAAGLTADTAACTTGSAAEAPLRRKASAGPSGWPDASAACSENTPSDSWCASWLVRCSELRNRWRLGWGASFTGGWQGAGEALSNAGRRNQRAVPAAVLPPRLRCLNASQAAPAALPFLAPALLEGLLQRVEPLAHGVQAGGALGALPHRHLCRAAGRGASGRQCAVSK